MRRGSQGGPAGIGKSGLLSCGQVGPSQASWLSEEGLPPKQVEDSVTTQQWCGLWAPPGQVAGRDAVPRSPPKMNK